MIGWMFAILGAIAGAAVSGGVTFIGMAAREKIIVAGAVSTERNAGVVTCNSRVAEIERVHNVAVQVAVDDAISATNQIEETPEDVAALKALCKASASCRSRGSL
jgi:hypothetical protein